MPQKLITLVRKIPPALAVSLSLLVFVCLWAYWPTLSIMAEKWQTDPQYSHGWLVPVFSVVLLWLRRSHLQSATVRGNWWGVLLIALGGLLHVGGMGINVDSIDAISLLVCLAGICVLFGGKQGWRWAWPSIAFLVFMIPLPFRVETALALPLRRVATLCSTYVMQTFGLPALAEGNTIHLDGGPIEVAEACSGLSMLLTFFAISTALAVLVERPLFDKIVLVASALPIAIVANVTRITATGVAQEMFGREAAHALFHDWAGWLMMPLALGMLWVELWLLTCLFPPRRLVDPLAMGRLPTSPAPAIKRIQKSHEPKRKKAASSWPRRR